MNLIIWKNGKGWINGKLAFYFFNTFGFPVELFEEMVNDFFKRHPRQRIKFIIKAYNRTYGTEYTYSR